MTVEANVFRTCVEVIILMPRGCCIIYVEQKLNRAPPTFRSQNSLLSLI